MLLGLQKYACHQTTELQRAGHVAVDLCYADRPMKSCNFRHVHVHRFR